MPSSTRSGVDRRGFLRNAALTSAAVAGLGTVAGCASLRASTGGDPGGGLRDRESLSGGGSSAACAEAELSIGLALDGDSTPYADTPAPVFATWCAGIEHSSHTTRITDLTMSVTVEDDSADDGWRLEDKTTGIREAPREDGPESLCRVGVSHVGSDWWEHFRSTRHDRTRGSDERNWVFGTVADSADGVLSNAGWIRFHLENHTTGDPDGECRLRVETTATVEHAGPYIGPCGGTRTGDLRCEETLAVEFV